MCRLSIKRDDFPPSLALLKSHKDFPLLYYKGNIDLLKEPMLSFAGSREASEENIKRVKELALDATRKGVTIVSGYARGIDTAAHYAAIAGGGNTIAVLAEGLDRFQVKSQFEKAWDWDRCLVISFYPPHSRWQAAFAMKRNQAIAALGKALVIGQCRLNSGTFNAGNFALEAKIPLYCIDLIDKRNHDDGSKALIRKGANPIYVKRENNKLDLETLYKSHFDIQD